MIGQNRFRLSPFDFGVFLTVASYALDGRSTMGYNPTLDPGQPRRAFRPGPNTTSSPFDYSIAASTESSDRVAKVVA